MKNGDLPTPTLIAELAVEELYYSALDKALAKDFTLANKALRIFDNYPVTQSAGPFYGQMEFMNGKFDYAAMTFGI